MSCCLGSTPFYFWKHLHIVRHIEFKNAFPKFRSRERKFEQPLARGLFWSRLFFILFAFETVWEVLLSVRRWVAWLFLIKYSKIERVLLSWLRGEGSGTRSQQLQLTEKRKLESWQSSLWAFALSFFSFLFLFLPTFSIFSLYLYLY